MITNDRQYKIVKSQVDDFQNALEGLSFSLPDNVHPKIVDAHKNAIESQLNDLLAEIREYEDLKEGRTIVTEIHAIEELPLALIRARIANRLTQAELADKLGLKMQQIQRYEADQYDSASMKTLIRIANVLGLRLNADVQLKTTDAPGDLDISNYPFKQMFQRNWFGKFLGSFNDAAKQSPRLLQELFETAGMHEFRHAFNRQSVRANSNFNPFALNAWYARVLIKAKEQRLTTVFDKSLIDQNWLRILASLSREEDAPVKAANYLMQNGIRFIIEPTLEGTFLDGAALLGKDEVPIIAMTLRYDRLDNFWFVLFHELAHVILHLNNDLNVIFDDLDVTTGGFEQEADAFALNSLIPDETWRKSLVRFSPSNQAVINESEKLKVHPALVAGRVRRETGKYFILNDLIGQGDVKKYFENAW